MTFLATLGRYVQDSLSTITPKKIFESIANIYSNYKRPRSIWTLTWAVLGAGGVGVLFIMQPQTLSYFQPIVLKVMPFAGDVGSKIGVFVIGTWVGGALGHNAAKYTAQQFALKVYGHSNTAYIIKNPHVARIVHANPQIYGVQREPERELDIEMGDPAFSHNLGLKKLLLEFRHKIFSHKNDPSSAHGTYKHALLAALRSMDLGPIYDVLRMNEAKREAREEYAQLTANYLAPPRLPVRPSLAASSSSSEGAPSLHIERIDVIPEPALDVNRDAFKHFKRRMNGLLKGRFYDLTSDSANHGSDKLDVNEKRELLVKLNDVKQAQRQKAAEERARIPAEFHRIRNASH